MNCDVPVAGDIVGSMNAELEMLPLQTWAKRAVATGDAPGLSLGHERDGASTPRTWEAHGFAVDSGPLEEFKQRAGAMFKSETLAPVQDVPLDQLASAQGGVWRDKVEAIMKSPNPEPAGTRDADGYLVDHPRVIRNGGKFWIYDGNHRLEAARRSGAKTWPCRVVDLDTLEPDGGVAR